MIDSISRKIEVLKDDEWVETQLKDLKLKDIYRVFEEDGTLVLNSDGASVNIVLKEPEEINGTWYLEDEQYTKYPHPDVVPQGA